MGSYAQLRLGSFDLGLMSRDDIDPLVMTLFRETDKRITNATPEDVERIRDSEQAETTGEGAPPSITLVQYACPASVAIDRLELMGFTKEVAKAGFQLDLKATIERYERYATHNPQAIADIFRHRCELLRGITVNSWLEALKRIRTGGFERGRHLAAASGTYPQLLEYMLGEDWYGFPGFDPRLFLRLALEVSTPSDELIYDLTDLVNGGYFKGTNDVVAYANELLAADFAISRRIIILTEGTTDKWILERSLRLLYPHLSEYFHFMDFAETRVGGGAAELARMVKAFAAADIANRVVAVFDNDTAAAAALRLLEHIHIAENIVVLQYPDIELARTYPTLGPSGSVSMDVNGLAGSVELYLGEDVLRDADGLAPVEWTGYERGLHRYQGEVLNKTELHKRFGRKLSSEIRT